MLRAARVIARDDTRRADARNGRETFAGKTIFAEPPPSRSPNSTRIRNAERGLLFLARA